MKLKHKVIEVAQQLIKEEWLQPRPELSGESFAARYGGIKSRMDPIRLKPVAHIISYHDVLCVTHHLLDEMREQL